uniref:Cell division topological specificity factor MinE n=1 Tax=Araucaria cunninghamii TaxID=56994 RepID=A0A0D6R0E4_ARACU
MPVCQPTSSLEHHSPLLRNPAVLSKVDRVKSSMHFIRDYHCRFPQLVSPQWQLSFRSIQTAKSHPCYGIMDDGLPKLSVTQETEDFVRQAVNMSFFERLNWAWNILFPGKHKGTSNAEIAKQRLKMILISDRCEVTDEAKRKIVNNIVDALSDFVEIESEDKVQLNVSADPDLGTVYSVTVPVRRVRPEYQEYSGGFGDIQNLEYRDVGGELRTFDIKLDYPSPNDGQV